MPFPEMNDIRRIGRIVYDQMTMGCKVDFDRTVAEVMGVERMYMAASDGAEEVHEQSGIAAAGESGYVELSGGRDRRRPAPKRPQDRKISRPR